MLRDLDTGSGRTGPGGGWRIACRAARPGVRRRRELADVRRELAGRDVRERRRLQDRTEVGVHRDPHLLQRLGRALVGNVLRALAADRGHRALDGEDDVGHRDVRRLPDQPIPALRSALGAHEARVAQVGRDVFSRNFSGITWAVAIASPFVGWSSGAIASWTAARTA